MKLRSRIEGMLEDSNALRVSNIGESLGMATEALRMSEAIHDHYLMARCHNELGLYQMISGKNELAAKHAKYALNYFEKSKNQQEVASALFTLGSIHYKSAEYALGLDYLLKCLEINRELKDLNAESRTLKSIGFIYEVFNDYDNAFETYCRCKEISKSIGDYAGESNAAIPIAALYLRREEVDNALQSIDESIQIKKKIKDNRGLAFAFYHKGKIKRIQKDYESSVKHLEKAISINEKAGENLGKALCYIELGGLFLDQKCMEKALEASENALKLAKPLSNDELTGKAYFLLYNIAKIREEHAKALEYHEHYHELMNSVMQAESAGKIKSQEISLRALRLEREAKIQKEKNEVIKRKNAELDSFVYRVSHDLKGPLSSMLGLRTIVKKDIKEGKALTYFDMYHSQAERLNEIVTGLIDLTRIKEKQLIKTEVDFKQIIKKCIGSFEHMPNLAKVSFDLQIDENIKFCSDHRVMTTILQNLIENSIKYSKDDGEVNEVLISVSTKGKRLNLSVSDKGMGIPHDLIPQVFDMFFRGNGNVPGSGLGLYILKNAVERIDGNVKVESKEGEGTRFTITLPY